MNSYEKQQQVFKTKQLDLALKIIHDQGQGDFWRCGIDGYCNSPIILEEGTERVKILEGWTKGKELVATTASHWWDEGGQGVTLIFANNDASIRAWAEYDRMDAEGRWGNIVTLHLKDMETHPEDYVIIYSGAY